MKRIVLFITIVSALTFIGLLATFGCWIVMGQSPLDDSNGLSPNDPEAHEAFVGPVENQSGSRTAVLSSPASTASAGRTLVPPAEIDPVEEQADPEAVAELEPINIEAMTGNEIAQLTDEDMARVPYRDLEVVASLRYSLCEPVLFLSTTAQGNTADFSSVWAGAIHGRDVPGTAFAHAKAELVRLRGKIQEIVNEERRATAFIESVPASASLLQRKRSKASWCLYAQRINERSRPFLNESETIVLGYFEIYEADVKLRW